MKLIEYRKYKKMIAFLEKIVLINLFKVMTSKF